VAVGREVAVKVDNRALLSDRDRRRFVREVTAAGRLSGHPHVIDVYDAGTLADGRPYLVMELCPAGSLNDLLRRRGPMSAAQVRDIGIRIADALAAAHAAGILHRDIKPANILVNRYGVVGLSDFGLASILAAGGEQSATRDALTPAYAPPESFRSEAPTVAADLYSLAATLYALLAGRPPRFPADGRSPSPAAIMMLHHEPVENVPGAPPELMALLRQSVAPDPRERPPSAAALRDALAALPARPAGTPAGAPMLAGPARPGQHASHGPAPATPSPASPGTHPPTVTAIPRRNPSGPAPYHSPSGPGKHDSPGGPGFPGSQAGPFADGHAPDRHAPDRHAPDDGAGA
jgi:serine/threonine protein kinase